ncbi:hypothetical protein OSTOST_24219, partial [Ostertagia ostertagi]
MEVDTATDDSASQASNTSASSMAIQYSVDELQENGTAFSDPNAEADKLGNMSWFKKKFPSVKTDVAKTENTAVHLPANVPPSIAKQKCLKQSLEKKLAERRRIGLAKRKELYMEDNEGLIEDEEEEEIDDGNDAQSSQKKKKEEEPEDSDDDYSADDEEEGKETDTESSQNSEMVDEDEEQKKSGAVDDLPESVDLFDGVSVAGSTVKDSQRLHDDEPISSHHRSHINDKVQCLSGQPLHPVD